MIANTNQLAFFDTFAAEEEKARTAHLPDTIEAALPCFRRILDDYDAATCAGDLKARARADAEADDLAIKLNGGDSMGMKCEDGAATKLAELTAAPTGTVPLWGQRGDFVVTVENIRVRIEYDGIFGLGVFGEGIDGFAAHAVDWDKPFISETGYRSFLGVHGACGRTLTQWITEVIKLHIRELCTGKKGKNKPLPRIEEEYRKRNQNTKGHT